MPAVDITSPTAPPTYDVYAILIALGLGVAALGVCGIIYKSLCLLLDWMDTKIEARNDLESQMSKAWLPAVNLQRPESALLSYQWTEEVGPLRPIVPPYLSFLPPPPPIYTGHFSFYTPEKNPETATPPFIFTPLPFGTSSPPSHPVYMDEKVVILPFASPEMGFEEPAIAIEESFAIPEKTCGNQQALEDSDSGAGLAAILARLDELESGRVPFAPLLKESSSVLQSIINMAPIAEAIPHAAETIVATSPKPEAAEHANITQAEKNVATPPKPLMKPTASKLKRTRAISLKTPLRPLPKKSNKENVRRSPSYMSPTAASRGRAGESSATPGKRRAL